MPNPALTLPGYKTYIVAFTVVMIGVSEGLLGADIPGVEVGPDWLEYVLTGLGVGSIRAALGKLIEAFTGN